LAGPRADPGRELLDGRAIRGPLEPELRPVRTSRRGARAQVQARSLLPLEVRDDPGTVETLPGQEPEHVRTRFRESRGQAGEPPASGGAGELERLPSDARAPRPRTADRSPVGVRRARRDEL